MTDGPQEIEITEEYLAQVEAAREGVEKAIREYIQALRGPEFPADPPYVQGWSVGVEWTNIWTEKANVGGQDLITPRGQMLAITRGLGMFLTRVV